MVYNGGGCHHAEDALVRKHSSAFSPLCVLTPRKQPLTLLPHNIGLRLKPLDLAGLLRLACLAVEPQGVGRVSVRSR